MTFFYLRPTNILIGFHEDTFLFFSFLPLLPLLILNLLPDLGSVLIYSFYSDLNERTMCRLSTTSLLVRSAPL